MEFNLRTLELDELKDQKVLKKWFKRRPRAKGDVAGHVCLHVQWRHDPAIAFEPFSEDAETETPNEFVCVSVYSRRSVDTHSSVSSGRS